MDRLTTERRSWLMSRVGARDTKPEIIVRRLVFGMGYRYRLHDRKLPGTPDLVFSGRRKIILVHGCFWHGHLNCRLGRTPKSNIEFWTSKIAANRARDLRVEKQLEERGWKVLVIWQCELKEMEKVANAIQFFLEK